MSSFFDTQNQANYQNTMCNKQKTNNIIKGHKRREKKRHKKKGKNKNVDV